MVDFYSWSVAPLVRREPGYDPHGQGYEHVGEQDEEPDLDGQGLHERKQPGRWSVARLELVNCRCRRLNWRAVRDYRPIDLQFATLIGYISIHLGAKFGYRMKFWRFLKVHCQILVGRDFLIGGALV